MPLFDEPIQYPMPNPDEDEEFDNGDGPISDINDEDETPNEPNYEEAREEEEGGVKR